MILFVLGCLVEGEDGAPGGGDSAEFYARVEPILVEGCANPSCHGNVERPYQVYAVHRYRLEETDLWADGELTEAEHQANLAQARAFAAEPWELCRKPLDPAVGGMSHEGGATWSSVDDEDYEAVRAWSEAP